jgi:hypothetical protein
VALYIDVPFARRFDERIRELCTKTLSARELDELTRTLSTAMQRHALELPITVAASGIGTETASGIETEVHGVTRDISMLGVFFCVDRWPFKAPVIEFKLIFPSQLTLTESKRAACSGRVLRIESLQSGRTGVAATIDNIILVDATAP